MFLLTVCRALRSHDVKFALVGGYAVSLHGATRGTLDVDIILPFEEIFFIRANEALNSIGLTSRIPVSGRDVYLNREHYLNEKNMAAWGFINSNNPGEVVDIVLTTDLNRTETINIQFRGENLPLVSRTALIEMKKNSARPQDLSDVAALLRLTT